jgi:hypothetical protein
MSSRLVELFSLRRFDFATLSASTTMDVELVRELRVIEWVETTLEVRVHAISMTSGGSIAVRLTPTSITPEDPAVAFLATSPVLSASVTSSTTAPALLTDTSDGVGGSLRLSVFGTRGSGAGSYWADISAVLVGKR